MKALNILLSIVVSILIAVLVFEGGLRLIGLGPPKGLNRFDPALGWSKKPDTTITRGTVEGFDVTYSFNEYGLRDDADMQQEKADGTYRVVALGDSFTLGFTVEREDLFVDLLEDWWKGEGRPIEVVNTGTEGYSTDQEVAWLLENGDAWQPDLVLLFAYENDVYWNGQGNYNGQPKPLFRPDGSLEPGELTDTGRGGWLGRTAIGRLFGFGKGPGVERFQPGSKEIVSEFGVLLDERPEFMADAVARTRGALVALKRKCAALGARAIVVPIPSHSAVDPDFASRFSTAMGLDDVAWSPDNPVELLLALAADAGLEALDVRPQFRERTRAGESLYFERDWHINPDGNRALTGLLRAELDRLEIVPAGEREASIAQAKSDEPAGLPGWLPWYAGLWLVLGSMYATVYRKDENPALGFFKVGALLAVVFTIAVGGTTIIGGLSPAVARLTLITVIIVILGFVIYKLGDRVGTITELLSAFVGRGHWYLMPLVTVLLTVGSLLVVAASSPLVAPFIYTLF